MPNIKESEVQSETADQESDQAASTAAKNDSDTAATQDADGQTDQPGSQPAPEGQQDFIGEVPKELEPFKKNILKKYFSKTRELAEVRRGAEQVKKDADTLQQLMAYTPFQDWYNAQKTGGTVAKATALSEEELEAIRTDPSKFDSFLTKRMESLMEGKYGSQMQSFQQKAEDLEVAKEYEEAEKAYGDDFTAVHKSGELDVYYDKGYDYESAYAMWNLRNGGFIPPGELDKAAGEKAARMVNKSRNASTEKPSSGSPNLPAIKIIPNNKSFGDVFDAAFEAVLKGEKVRIGKVEKGG